MGCSRPGAFATVCVLLAGVLSVLSLVLPYWSKLQIDRPAQEQVEISFGLWSSCVKMDLPLEIMDGSRNEAFICGSYYHRELVQISCTTFKQFSTGQCTRNLYNASASLCEHKQAASFLGNGVAPITMGHWLAFLDRACGPIGHTAVSFAVVSAVGTGLTLILLLIGVTCASIESCITRMGGWCAIATAIVQGVLSATWMAQIYVIKDRQLMMATSFYLNAISLGLHIAGFCALRKHQRLAHDAAVEVDLPLDFLEKEVDKAKSKSSRPIELAPV